ncbi:MAG: hypothetical protein Q7R72_01210 [bacterium]|nr:hypothetical protein [bacterium]
MKKFLQFLRNLFIVMFVAKSSESVQAIPAVISENLPQVSSETDITAPVVFIPRVRKEIGNGSRAAVVIASNVPGKAPKKAMVQTKAGNWLVFRIVRRLDDGTTIMRRPKHPHGGIVSARLFPV